MQSTPPTPSITAAASPLRVLPSRRPLPGSRAIVGGLLVALAAVGTFAAATGSTGDHRTSYVVTTRDLSVGTHVQPGDFSLARMQLAPNVATRAQTSVQALSGDVVVGPIKAGELVQDGMVVHLDHADQPQVALSLPLARALDGDLRPGESVDVIASGKGTGLPVVAVAGATVVHVDRSGGGSLGGSGDVIVTLAVASSQDATSVAGAVDQGSVTLVRVTGVSR